MRIPSDLPNGMIALPHNKAVLLFTPQEFLAAIRRGKWHRRRQAMLARQADAAQTPPNPRRTAA